MTFDPSSIEAVRRARSISQFINSRISGPIPNTPKLHLFGLFMSVVIEHHGAILLLLETEGHFGSAFALARPLVEAAFRAHWMLVCGGDEDVARIRLGKQEYPGFRTMASEIEKRYGTDRLFGKISESWEGLCGYAHTGIEQLARRCDAEGNIRPSYSTAEINEVANATTAQLVALAIAFCQAIGRNAQSEEISARYIELYPLPEPCDA
jgi:hypothetical protein